MNNGYQTEIRSLGRRLSKLWAVATALILATAFAAGCNGEGDGGGSPTVEPTAGTTTVEPTGQATTSAPCQALASLNSYRYVSNVTLESPEEIVGFAEGQTPVANLTREFEGDFYFETNIEASVVAPDRIDAFMSGSIPSSRLIIVGGKHWISADGQGQWIEVTPQYRPPYEPMDVCNTIFSELNLDQGQGEKETVNNVPARRYAFPGTPSGQAMATIFGPESDVTILMTTMDVEVWVAEEGGWPVQMDIQSSGLYANGRELRAHIRVELRDINNKDIRVEPPL